MFDFAFSETSQNLSSFRQPCVKMIWLRVGILQFYNNKKALLCLGKGLT